MKISQMAAHLQVPPSARSVSSSSKRKRMLASSSTG